MLLPKVAVGIPFYGNVPNEWWVQLAEHFAHIGKTLDYKGLIALGAMTADHSRNVIVDEFLKKTDAEWLFWIDSDTVVPIGGINRMLKVGKTMVSGLYYGKNTPHPPIAYHIHNGAYTPIDNNLRWEVGELLPVDTTGMGCMLTHRSVFEDIMENFTFFQGDGGGLYVVKKSSILGSVKEDEKHEHDNKIYKGQLRLRMHSPTLADIKFPFFQIANGMTEDVFFHKMAAECGHKVWLDTSIECSHLRYVGFTGEDYRKIYGH